MIHIQRFLLDCLRWCWLFPFDRGISEKLIIFLVVRRASTEKKYSDSIAIYLSFFTVAVSVSAHPRCPAILRLAFDQNIPMSNFTLTTSLLFCLSIYFPFFFHHHLLSSSFLKQAPGFLCQSAEFPTHLVSWSLFYPSSHLTFLLDFSFFITMWPRWDAKWGMDCLFPMVPCGLDKVTFSAVNLSTKWISLKCQEQNQSTDTNLSLWPEREDYCITPENYSTGVPSTWLITTERENLRPMKPLEKKGRRLGSIEEVCVRQKQCVNDTGMKIVFDVSVNTRGLLSRLHVSPHSSSLWSDILKEVEEWRKT